MNIKTRGFTLIELLTVISIIGVLSSVVLASLTSAKKRARDTAMRQTVLEYVNALRMYKTDHNGYLPLGGDPNVPGGDTSPSCLGSYSDYCEVMSYPNSWQSANNLLQQYIPIKQADETVIQVSGSDWKGITYSCAQYDANTNCIASHIYWPEHDKSGKCGSLPNTTGITNGSSAGTGCAMDIQSDS